LPEVRGATGGRSRSVEAMKGVLFAVGLLLAEIGPAMGKGCGRLSPPDVSYRVIVQLPAAANE
jgi:hypothetical protein